MIRVVLRVTLVVFAMICLVGGCSLIIFNLTVMNNIESSQTQRAIFTANIIIILVSFIGLFLSALSILLLEIRGLKVYDKIIENVDLADKSVNNLSKLNFPEKDELGNLGQKVKRIIDIIASFDELKKQIINRQGLELDFVINNYPYTVVMIDHNYNIIKSNSSFKDIFSVTNPINESIFNYINLLDQNLKALIDAYEKQNFESSLTIKNEIHKTKISFKRFYKENGTYDYIIFFTELKKEEEKKKLKNQPDNKNDDDDNEVRFEVTENNNNTKNEDNK
jgi:hypothetical protein